MLNGFIFTAFTDSRLILIILFKTFKWQENDTLMSPAPIKRPFIIECMCNTCLGPNENQGVGLKLDQETNKVMNVLESKQIIIVLI